MTRYDRTHLLNFTGSSFPPCWGTESWKANWVITPPHVKGVSLAAAGAVASLGSPYMPSEIAMRLFRTILRRLHDLDKVRPRDAGSYRSWGGMVTSLRRRPKIHKNPLIRGSIIPSAEEIASASEVVRAATAAGARTKIVLAISTHVGEEPTITLSETEDNTTMVATNISMDAPGIVYLGDFFRVCGSVQDKLCCLAIDFLKANCHAWDGLTPHYLFVLDRWLLRLSLRQTSEIHEIRSLITELLELALGTSPPFLNPQTGFYTVLPGDFRSYMADFMRSMPQMPGASGPARYYLGQAAREPNFQTDVRDFTEVFSPRYLVTKGRYSRHPSIFNVPAAQAPTANPILWEMQCSDVLYCRRDSVRHSPRDGSRSQPIEAQRPLLPPHVSHAYMTAAARFLHTTIPVNVRRILEFDSAGGDQHRTVVGGITVYRALRDARACARRPHAWRPEDEIVLLTTRSPLEVLAMLTGIGFELADPEHRALTDLYGVAGFLNGRSIFRRGQLTFLEKAGGQVKVTVQYLESYIPETDFAQVGWGPRPASLAQFTLCDCVWVPGSGGPGWIFGPGIPNPNPGPPTLPSYGIRVGPRFNYSSEELYERIREFASDGYLPRASESVGFATNFRPTNLADARFYADRAEPSLWQAPFYVQFMENYTWWRETARNVSRSEHYRLRSDFEARDREILAQYLRVGAELMESSTSYSSLLADVARREGGLK
jgi:hypothetical protein